jgi:glycine cleavage system H protein
MFSTFVRYTKTHEYIKLENNMYTIGITRHLYRKLNPIIYSESHVDLGDIVSHNTPLLLVESSKIGHDILSPVNGEIKEINRTIISNYVMTNSSDTPNHISSNFNEDVNHYIDKNNWLFKVSVDDSTKDNNMLMDLESYNTYISSLP